MKKILSADIGATNSRFASFGVNAKGALEIYSTRWFDTREFNSFNSLMSVVREIPVELSDIDIAVISVAGPVERSLFSDPPFIPWNIDVSNAGKDFGLKRSLLINDFVAQAYACQSPIGKSAEQILSGNASPDGTVAVIGAGSNLGKAALVPDGRGGYVAVPSEGGHANFPFESKQEFEFQKYLLQKIGHRYVTGNKVVSGQGLSYIHAFLTGEEYEPQEVTARFNSDSETLQWASRFYGRACRNYALETAAVGGLYIAGGVAAKVPDLVRHPAFKSEFRISSTMADLLKKIPLFLMRNEESGLWGGAFLGLQMLRKEK
jgi:glucokinase